MAGDFSRSSFERRKHYSAVRMQQGRVQLDADWNEQADLTRHGVETRAKDFIGPSGAPHDAAGFALEPVIVHVFDGRDDAVTLHLEPQQRPRSGEPFHLELRVQPRPRAGGTLLHLLTSDGLSWARLALRESAVCLFLEGEETPTLRTGALDWSRLRHLQLSWSANEVVLRVDGQVTATARVETARGGGDVAEKLIIGAAGGEESPSPFSGALDQVRLGRGRGESLAVWPSEHRHRKHGHEGGHEGHLPHRRVLIYLGPGRYYVDGILCENEQAVPLDAQPDLPAREPGLSDHHLSRGLHLAVLDVWERLITSHEDPDLREVALGGSDTAVRTRTVWQVHTVRVDADPEAEDLGEETPAWRSYRAGHESVGRMRARHVPEVAPMPEANLLYRAEIHDEGERVGAPLDATGAWPHPVVTSSTDTPDEVVFPSEKVDGRFWFAGRWVEVVGPGGAWATTISDVEDERVRLSEPLPEALRGQQVTLRPLASLKWSRNNGCDALAIKAVEGVHVRLMDPVGHHGVTISPGDVVECVDEHSVLTGHPFPLRRVIALSADRLGVTLDAPAPADFAAGVGARPLLRRWDRSGASPQGLMPVQGEWVELERGIQLQFEGDAGFRSGQYWLLPVRAQSEVLSWPSDDRGPLAKTPDGGLHRHGLLAMLRVDADGHVVLEDRRRLFAPLTTRGASSPGDEPGPVTFPDTLRVLGGATIDGELSAGSITGHLAPRTVQTAQLHDHAVTEDKLATHAVHPRHLAPELGLLPPGAVILTDSRQPPSGFEFTHRSVEIESFDPEWRMRRGLPGGPSARVVLLSLNKALYALLEGGQIWRSPAVDAEWTLAGQLFPSRPGFGAAVVGNRIHVLGGLDEKGCPVATHQAFDPARDVWTVLEPMPTPRSEPALAVLDDELFVLGGRECWPLAQWSRPAWLSFLRRSSAAAEVYSARKNQWLKARNLPTPVTRAGAAMRAGEGELHLVGGLVKGIFGSGSPSPAHQVLDLTSNRWEARAPLRRPRAGLGLVASDERLYAVGGVDKEGPVSTVERYSPSNDAWSALSPLPLAVQDAGTSALAGELVVLGGMGAAGPQSAARSCAVASQMYLHRKPLSESAQASASQTEPSESDTTSSSSGSTSSGASSGQVSSLRPTHFRPPLYDEPVDGRKVALGTAIAAALVLLVLGGGYVLTLGKGILVSRGRLAEGVFGIDVSQHQGDVDWASVEKGGMGFAFVKATEGLDFVDPKFDANWKGLRGTKLLKGAYHFFRPKDDAVSQAEFYLKTTQLSREDLPPVLDVEMSDDVPADLVGERARIWLQHVEKALGRKPLLYVYPAFWNKYLKKTLEGYKPMWISDDTNDPTLPENWDGFAFWQYTDAAKLSGVKTCVDRNWFPGTAAELRLFAATGVLPLLRGSELPRGSTQSCRSPGSTDVPKNNTGGKDKPVPTKPPDPNKPPKPKPPDAGAPDAGPTDAGPKDAGSPGTRTPDAGSPDGGSSIPSSPPTSEVVPFDPDTMPEPVLLYQDELEYTEEAYRDRVEGLAIAKCTLETTGHVTHCRVIKSPPGLNEAVADMLESSLYKPIVVGKKKIAVSYAFYLHLVPPAL